MVVVSVYITAVMVSISVATLVMKLHVVCCQLLMTIKFIIFRLDALALSVIATATWLAGWLGGWLSVTAGIVSK